MNARRALLLAWALACTHSASAAPLGALTSLRGATVEGWVCGLDSAAAVPAVDIFLNGAFEAADGTPRPAWQRYRGVNERADHLLGVAEAVPASDLPTEACGGTGWRYRFTVPREQRSAAGPGVHALHVALRLGAGRWQTLQGSPANLVVRGRSTPVLGWVDDFRTACVRRKHKRWPPPPPDMPPGEPSWSLDPPVGTCPAGSETWVLESTNETRSFMPLFDVAGRRHDTDVDLTSDARPSAPWKLRFVRRSAASHRVTHAVDRSRGPAVGTPLDAYLAAMLQTELGPRPPSLDAPLFIDLSFRLRQHDGRVITRDDAAGGRLDRPFDEIQQARALAARWRATLGLLLSAPAPAPPRFLEINLAASRARPDAPSEGSFDLCDITTPVEALHPALPCERVDAPGGDETRLFDRRSTAVPIIYVDLGQVHRLQGLRQPVSVTRDGWSTLRLPVNGLVRNAPWLDRPGMNGALPLRDGMADLRGVALRAIYLGSETWGDVRLGVEFERLRLYRFVAD